MRSFTLLYLIIGCLIFYPPAMIAQRKTEGSATAVRDDSVSIHNIDAAEEATYTNNNTVDKKSYLKAGLSYLTNNVYLGRKDSVALPYLTPLLGYYHKSGLFVEGSAGFLANAQSRVDVISFDGGYTFNKGAYMGEITAAKYFYNTQSTSIKSEVKGSLGYFNSYDFGCITPTVTGTLNFGNKTDIAAQFGLEHTFWALDDQANITPTFSVNASTQNYYSDYYKNRRYKIKKKGKPVTTGIATVYGTLPDASAFKVLDYEISVPVNYHTGKFSFSFIPVYAIPVHPSQVEVTTTLANNTSTTKTHAEKIENSFFGTISIVFKFGK